MSPGPELPVLVKPEAEADISEAFRWYEERSEGLGSDFMRALDACLSRIRRYPTAHTIVHKQARRALLRRFPYSLIYAAENGTIVVFACYHTNRDPKAWQGRVDED